MNIPKITILLDHGYHPEHLRQELEKVYPQIMRKIKFELSTKPSRTREGSPRKVWREFQQ
jgi:hypothetical protein